MKVAVGIATRGGKSLAPLLEALARQRHKPDVILVGATRTSHASDAANAEALGLPFAATITDTVGYVTNRNAVIEAASDEGVTHLCWIDDDERPESDWIAELLRVSDAHAAGVVLGPIRRDWPQGAPRWARRADLPRRTEYEEGPCADAGRTGNCLLVLADSELAGLSFDVAYQVSGGEDVDLIRRARARGATVAWAPRAVVHESVSEDMFRRSWYLRRAWRNGLVNGSTGQGLDLRRLPKALLLTASGVIRLRGDEILRAGWELAFLSGQLAGRVRAS